MLGLSILSDLRKIIACIRAGDILGAAAIAVRYSDTPEDDRAVALIDEIARSDDPEVWFSKGFELVSIVVKLTPTAVDDAVLEAVERLKGDPAFAQLLAWVRSLWDPTNADLLHQTSGAAQQAGGDPSTAFPLPVIVSIASLIVNLVRLVRESRNR